ncbi:hypothetical protein J1605_021427 [Eschrichtius robustus]|uniref:Uncharacterized protein n=1 Tax=Eschrichtius robustus TaxID=9764 RepID=A0AB34HHV9_ESCRO|nr:hypothetical protein J1605_021427 [Eschrichtius robustus]
MAPREAGPLVVSRGSGAARFGSGVTVPSPPSSPSYRRLSPPAAAAAGTRGLGLPGLSRARRALWLGVGQRTRPRPSRGGPSRLSCGPAALGLLPNSPGLSPLKSGTLRSFKEEWTPAAVSL